MLIHDQIKHYHRNHHTRNTTIPVLFVSVVYSNFSGRTTDFIRLIRNRERKVLCINRQSSVLNSICNKGGYTNNIRKGTRNTTVPVLFLSVAYTNFSGGTTDLIRNRERKVLCINRQSSVLYSICIKGGYTNEIRKRTRNISTTVYMVSFVRRKGIE